MKVEVLYRAGNRQTKNTVCLIRRSDSRFLYLRWYDEGRPVYQSLEHEDQELGEDEADDVAKILRKGGNPQQANPLTLAELLAAYASAKHKPRPAPGGRMLKPEKSARQIQKDGHWMGLARMFFTATIDALEVKPESVGGYVEWRREQGIGDTTIGHELVFFRAVYEWGRKRKLIPENPIEDVKRIRSVEPNTPVAEPATFALVYRYSDRADAQKLLRPMMMMAHEHGWRVGAWCNLSIADIDLRPRAFPDGTIWPFGAIRKDRQHDKKKKGGWVPLTRRSRRAAVLLLRRRQAIGDVLAFPAPKARTGAGAAKPWRVEHAIVLLHRAEALATAELRRRGLLGEEEEVSLGGFHSLRRKWGSDRKDEPLVDVADAGDWHPATLLGHYQKPDPKTTLRVTLREGVRAVR